MDGKKIKGLKLPEIRLPEKQKKVLLIAVLVLGFGVLLAGYRGIPSANNNMRVDEQIPNLTTVVSYTSAITQAEAALEQRLERILTKMDGVGNV